MKTKREAGFFVRFYVKKVKKKRLGANWFQTQTLHIEVPWPPFLASWPL